MQVDHYCPWAGFKEGSQTSCASYALAHQSRTNQDQFDDIDDDDDDADLQNTYIAKNPFTQEKPCI